MDARTAVIAFDAARIRKGHTLKLRVVQHKYATQIAAHARAVDASKLVRLHAKFNAEAIAIAGPDYADHHTVGFDEYDSIAEHQADNESCCSVEGAGLVNVVEMANTMTNCAGRVAACSAPGACALV